MEIVIDTPYKPCWYWRIALSRIYERIWLIPLYASLHYEYRWDFVSGRKFRNTRPRSTVLNVFQPVRLETLFRIKNQPVK